MRDQVLTHELLGGDVVEAAQALLGCTLVCRGTAGVIVESEAYHQDEPSCHAHRGVTPRTKPLFGPPGHAYVYFTYGMHWCFNVVCEEAGIGAAVLVRAVAPVVGLDLMRTRRQRSKPLADRELCSGPAKLVQAMGIRSADNERDVLGDGRSGVQSLLKHPDALAVVRDDLLAEQTGAGRRAAVVSGPRIGISQAQDLPWRFGIAGSPWLSKPFPE